MLRKIKSALQKYRASHLKPEGEEGIQVLGHREYVGGRWHEIGELQFKFLVENGLKPSHCLLDIACGSLRGGVYFINYLDRGKYLGIDKEKKLIGIGIDKELGSLVYKEKNPEFIISDRFEFKKFSQKPQFSLAQSLFTHLNPEDIQLCLHNLRNFVDTGHIFFATFFEGQSFSNLDFSQSHTGFKYSSEEMAIFGKETGWKPVYIGNWNHPRHQVMIKYET